MDTRLKRQMLTGQLSWPCSRVALHHEHVFRCWNCGMHQPGGQHCYAAIPFADTHTEVKVPTPYENRSMPISPRPGKQVILKQLQHSDVSVGRYVMQGRFNGSLEIVTCCFAISCEPGCINPVMNHLNMGPFSK